MTGQSSDVQREDALLQDGDGPVTAANMPEVRCEFGHHAGWVPPTFIGYELCCGQEGGLVEVVAEPSGAVVLRLSLTAAEDLAIMLAHQAKVGRETPPEEACPDCGERSLDLHGHRGEFHARQLANPNRKEDDDGKFPTKSETRNPGQRHRLVMLEGEGADCRRAHCSCGWHGPIVNHEISARRSFTLHRDGS